MGGELNIYRRAEQSHELAYPVLDNQSRQVEPQVGVMANGQQVKRESNLYDRGLVQLINVVVTATLLVSASSSGLPVIGLLALQNGAFNAYQLEESWQKNETRSADKYWATGLSHISMGYLAAACVVNSPIISIACTAFGVAANLTSHSFLYSQSDDEFKNEMNKKLRSWGFN